jgi:hypothetical protein
VNWLLLAALRASVVIGGLGMCWGASKLGDWLLYRRERPEPRAGDMVRHPAVRHVMTGPVPPDGEPLSADEGILLAAVLYSLRNEDAPEPGYRRQR